MHNKIVEAAGRCAETVQEIWRERDEENEEWLDSIITGPQAEENRRS